MAKTKFLHIRVTNEQYDRLKSYAKCDDTTMSDVMTKYIDTLVCDDTTQGCDDVSVETVNKRDDKRDDTKDVVMTDDVHTKTVHTTPDHPIPPAPVTTGVDKALKQEPVTTGFGQALTPEQRYRMKAGLM